jgi:hypothetical protein
MPRPEPRRGNETTGIHHASRQRRSRMTGRRACTTTRTDAADRRAYEHDRRRSRRSGRIAAFQQGLQQLGWVAGRNVRIEYRWGAGNANLYKRYAPELVALAPDVLLAAGGTAAGALQQVIPTTVPIIFKFSERTPDSRYRRHFHSDRRRRLFCCQSRPTSGLHFDEHKHRQLFANGNGLMRLIAAPSSRH